MGTVPLPLPDPRIAPFGLVLRPVGGPLATRLTPAGNLVLTRVAERLAGREVERHLALRRHQLGPLRRPAAGPFRSLDRTLPGWWPDLAAARTVHVTRGTVRKRPALLIPYADLLPLVDVGVTNGRWDAALAHGVALIVGGETEDEMEVATRVA